ncbi:MAG: hypothetical protein L0H93_15765, partial [Nocardioides sp.]|nr:hypothetical protein [Nocardioides sp.]
THGFPLRTTVRTMIDESRRRMRRESPVEIVDAHACGPPGSDKAPDPDTAPVTAPLGDDEIVNLCLPQVAKCAEYPMYSVKGVSWSVANKRFCTVPEKGHTQDPVPFDTFTPDPSDQAAILQLCDATNLPQSEFDFRTEQMLPPEGTTRDLRGGTVVKIDARKPVVEALVRSGNKIFECALSPATWDAGIRNVGTAFRSDRKIAFNGRPTGSSSKSIVPEEAAYYNAARTTDPRARSIEVGVEGGHRETYPVTDGRYAILHEETGPGGLRQDTYAVRDGSAKLLFDGELN